jgi:hypothetical protein
LYTLLSAIFVRLIPFGDIGHRTNLLSALFGSAAITVLWIFLRRLGVGRISAFAATLSFAFGVTFWSQCLMAEVHALNTLLLGLTLLFVFEAARSPSPRTFAVSGLLIGLTVGHRNLNLLFLAPQAAILARASRTSRAGNHLRLCALGALVGSAIIYLYLPIATSRHPPIEVGAPTTFSRFLRVVSAQAYRRHLHGPPVAIARRLLGTLLGLPANLGVALLAVPFGAWNCRRRSPATLIPCGWTVLTCAGFAASYNVLDVEAYLIPAYLCLAILAGFGFDTWRVGRWRTALPVLACGLLLLNTRSVSLRDISIARDYGRQLIASAPQQAVILSFGDTSTHILDYMQQVQGKRPDVVVVSASEVDEWYVEHLSRRYPEIAWPTAREGGAWLTELIQRAERSRPVCLTQPVDVGTGQMRLVARGLLFCRAAALDARSLEESVAFWKTAIIPSEDELRHREIHVQMIDFSFALSRFLLAQALVEIGNITEARAQLRAVVDATPDDSERAIVAAMKTIGREAQGALSLGDRAREALRLGPSDPRLPALLRL